LINIALVLRRFLPQRGSIRKVGKEASWIFLGQAVSVAGMLVFVRLLTEYLAPDEYGELALGITMAGLVNQVVMGGAAAGIGRFYSVAADGKDLGAYLRAASYLLLYSTLAVVVLGLILIASLYGLGQEKWLGVVVAALAFSIVSGYNSALNGIQNAARQRAIVAFHAGFDSWLKILLVTALMFWLGESSAIVIMGYACSSLLVTISQLIFLRRTVTPLGATICSSGQWLSRMWAYSFPLYTFGLFTWMQRASDRWALQAFVTPSEVGQYVVLFQLGFAPIILVTGMAMSLLSPILYRLAGDATDRLRNKNVHELSWRITRLFLLITLMCFGFTLVLHQWLFLMLVAKEYRSMSYLLPWVVLAGGIFSAGQMLALKFMSEMRSSTMIAAKIVTAVLGVLFNGFGAALAGVHGVVGALLAFSIIYLLWMMLLASRQSAKV
jgi:O-antigen/teichoic acid export membrane protein